MALEKEKEQSSHEQLKEIYAFVRVINRALITSNFHLSTNPYSLHVGYHPEHGFVLYSYKDGAVSIIDAKTRAMSNKHLNDLTGTLSTICQQKDKHALLTQIQNWAGTIVKEYQQDALMPTNMLSHTEAKSITAQLKDQKKSPFPSTSADADTTEKDNKNCTADHSENASLKSKLLLPHAIRHKLFTMTVERYPEFRKTQSGEEEGSNTIRINHMTTVGEQYFFDSIIKSLFDYLDDTNFLGKNWKEYIFGSGFITYQTYLKQGIPWTEKMIVDFVVYLLSKEARPRQENPKEHAIRQQKNKTKSDLLNFMFTMLYSESKYNYDELKEISGHFASSLPEMTQKTYEWEGHTGNQFFTEGGLKGLESIASKELRGQEVTDYLRSRTRIDDTLLTGNKKLDILEKNFTASLENLVEYYGKKGYHIYLESIELANKWKEDAKKLYQIDITEEDEASLMTSVQKFVDNHNNTLKENINDKSLWEEITKKSDKKSELYDFDFNTVKWNGVDDTLRDIGTNVMKTDAGKTGGQGGVYADIKTRTRFILIKMKQEPDSVAKDSIIRNMSYEHQIVNMQSQNESGLSDHNIFLDPLKTLQMLLRKDSAIDIHKFTEAVSGGINKTIDSIALLQGYLDHSELRPQNMPINYIKQQLKIRNQIPKEILQEAQIDVEKLTYTDIDTGSYRHLKSKLELGIAKYILKEQIRANRLHFFFYDDNNPVAENVDTSTAGEGAEISKNNKIQAYTIWNKNLDELIDEVFAEPTPGKYCLAGGGSHNMARSLTNSLYTSDGKFCIYHNENFYLIPSWYFANFVSSSRKINRANAKKLADTTENLLKVLEMQ